MHPVLQAENKEQFYTELEVHLDQQRYLRSLLIQYHPIIHQVSYNFQCLKCQNGSFSLISLDVSRLKLAVCWWWRRERD